MRNIMKFRIPKIAPKIALGFACLVFALTLSVVAEGATKTRWIKIEAGKAETISLPGNAADVLVANPAIADVGSLRADKLYIVGKAVGDTNVLAFDAEGNQLADISVNVSRDQASLEKTLRELFPKEQITVRTIDQNIVLGGKVSTPSVANQVRDMATRFIPSAEMAQGRSIVDLMTVQGEQQVMLKVKVLEAKRAVLREFGFDLDYKDVTSATNAGYGTIGGTGLAALAPFAAGQLFFDDNNKFGPLKIALQALERDGLVNTLAEPSLTAISGETAGFLAGGEFPVPTGRDQDGNITLEFKQFGVSLNFSPTVLSNDRISLQLATEVSAKSDADSVTLVNTIIPGLAVRRAQTTVQMGSGGTIMIAGLLKSDTIDSLNGMPGAKDLPIIGELFKSKSFQRNESELVILVTPYIVKPYAESAAERVATEDHPQPRPIMDNITTPVPAVNGINAPKRVIPPGDEGKGNFGDERTHKLGQRAAVEPRQYPRFGEEDRTSGGSRIATFDKRKHRGASPEALAAVAPAAGDPLETALKEIDGKKQVATVDLPRPLRKPGQAEHALAFAAKIKKEAEKVEADLALNNPTFVEPVISQPLGAGEILPPPPLELKFTQKAAADTLPRPLPKPGQKRQTAAADLPKAAVDKTAAAKATPEKSASSLSSTFMKNLGKVYGKKVPSAMGETHRYGYIVD